MPNSLHLRTSNWWSAEGSNLAWPEGPPDLQSGATPLWHALQKLFLPNLFPLLHHTDDLGDDFLLHRAAKFLDYFRFIFRQRFQTIHFRLQTKEPPNRFGGSVVNRVVILSYPMDTPSPSPLRRYSRNDNRAIGVIKVSTILIP